MIEYLLISCYDCRQYGLFPSVEAAQAYANEVYKKARLKERKRIWNISKFEDKYLVGRSIYWCINA